MNEERLIQWPEAVYWTTQFNPMVGCKPVSPACDNCYARAWAERFNIPFTPHKSKKKNPPSKGVCFCGNVTDLFGDWVDDESLHNWMVKTIGNDAYYLWLTKRPVRMANQLAEFTDPVFQRLGKSDLSRNYYGFTAENQEWYDKRFRAISSIPDWVNMWVSCEPLLGPIDFGFSKILSDGQKFDIEDRPYQWIVCGAESGKDRRTCKIEWIEGIVNQCLSAGIPVFVKQICLPDGRFSNKIEEFPEHLRIRQVPWFKETV